MIARHLPEGPRNRIKVQAHGLGFRTQFLSEKGSRSRLFALAGLVRVCADAESPELSDGLRQLGFRRRVVDFSLPVGKGFFGTLLASRALASSRSWARMAVSANTVIMSAESPTCPGDIHQLVVALAQHL